MNKVLNVMKTKLLHIQNPNLITISKQSKVEILYNLNMSF